MGGNNKGVELDDYEEIVLSEAEGSLEELEGYVSLDGRGPSSVERERARQTVTFLRSLVRGGRSAPSMTAQILHDIGVLYGRTLEDPEEALTACREAFQRQPKAVHIARGYRKAVLRAGGSPRELVAALEAEARSTSHPEQRAPLELARGRLLEEPLDNAEAARSAYEQAVKVDPTYIPAMRALERLAVKGQAPVAAARHAEMIAETVTDPLVRGEHYARVARHLERAMDLEGALTQAANAKVGALTSPAVSYVLERLHSQESQTQSLIALRESQMAERVIDPAHTWFEVGVLARYRLGDVEKARKAYEFSLALWDSDDDSRLVLLRELSPLLRVTSSWTRLVEVESRRGELEPTPTARAAAWHRVGTVQEKQLDDEDAALESFERALREDRGYSPALKGAGRIYLRKGSRDRLLAMHELEAESNVTLAERASALRRAGELLIDTPDRLAEGIEALRLAVELLPGDLASLRVLERAFARQGAWEDLAYVYEEQLEHCKDPTLRGFLLRQLARTTAEHIGDRQRAIAALREMAALRVTPPPAHLVALAQLLEEEGELDELITVLESLVEKTKEPEEVASQLERIAEIHERRGDLDAAVDAYRRALEIAPISHPVMVSAARVFLRTGHYDELANLYLQAASDGAGWDQARWLHKAATVMIDHLDRRHRAVDILRHALTVAPEYLPARLTLEELLIEEENWLDLAALTAKGPHDGATLLRQAMLNEAIGEAETATSLYARAADAGVSLAEVPLLRCMAASGSWARLFERYRSNEQGPLDEVHRLYRAAEIAVEQLDDGDSARELLEEILDRAPDNIAALVTLIELDVSTTERTQELLKRLHHLTEDSNLQRECLTEIRLSLENITPTDDVLAEQLSLVEQGLLDPLLLVSLELNLEARSDRKQLAEVLRKLVGSPGLESGLVAELQAHLATLLEELGALQQAADALESSLAATRDAPSVARRISLIRLYEALGDHAKQQVSLGELATSFPPGPERSMTLRLVSSNLSEQLDDAEGVPELAINALEEALKDNPLDYHSLQQLDGLLELMDDRSRLIHHLMRAFSTEQEPQQVATIGPVLAAKLLRAGRLEPALEVLDRTLAISPSNLEALKILAEVHRKTGAWVAAAQRLRQVINHKDSSLSLKMHANWYLAAILVHKLDDIESVRDISKTLDGMAGEHPKALTILFSIQELLGDHDVMAQTLERLSEVDGIDATTKTDALLRLGKLQEEHFGDTLSAMKALAVIDGGEHQRSALRDVLRLAETTDRWDLAAESLDRTLASEHGFDRDEELEHRRRLVGLLDGQLDRSTDAIPHYERIAELEPSDATVLSRLAELSFAGEPEKAIAHHRALIELQPDHVQSYRALRQLLLRQEQEDAVFCVEAVLDGLGLANEEESYFYAQRRSRLEGKLDGALTDDDWIALCPPLSSPSLAVLRALQPVIHDIFPVDLASLGLGSAEDPQNLRTIEETVIETARLFEIPKFQVLLTPPRLGPSTLGSNPVTLLTPRYVADCLPREQLFIFGALFGRARTGGVLFDPLHVNRITDQQLSYVIWATCEMTLPSYEAPTERNPIFLDIRERLGAALPHERPSELVEACQRLVDTGFVVDSVDLRREANRTAARAGTLACVDPSLSIACLRRWPNMFTRDDLPEDSRGLTPETWAGPVFAVSATYQAIRERLSTGVRS